MSEMTLEKQIRMGMNLVDHEEFSTTIRTISHIAASVVAKTLGPYAHTTTIDDGNFTYPTKDGWNILSRLKFQDQTHQSIFNTLKNISARIVDKVGDGTTTAMVTADHFMQCLTDALEEDPILRQARQADIIEALNTVRDKIIEELQKMAIQIAPDPSDMSADFQDIYNVAYISSNGNKELANIMQEIYKATHNTNISVDKEGGTKTSYEIQRGFRLDATLQMPNLYRNTSEGYYSTLGAQHFLVCFDHNVTYSKHAAYLEALMTYSHHTGNPLIIMAPYFDDMIAAQFMMSVQEQLKAKPNSIPGTMLLQIPEMNRKAVRDAADDFTVVTGTKMINPTVVRLFNVMRHNAISDDEHQEVDPAMKLDDYSHFPTCQDLMTAYMTKIVNATVTKTAIIFSDEPVSEVLYKERLAEVREEYEQAKAAALQSPTNLMKRLLEASTRYSRLQGEMGIIHVGGISDLERSCNMDVVDDTYRACRSAYENGVVPGMNLGTLTAIYRICKSDSIASNSLEDAVLGVLWDAFKQTTVDILHSKVPSDELYHWCIGAPEEDGGDGTNGYVSNIGFVDNVVELINSGKITGYNIVTDKPCTSKIPEVCNSVATDIEILYGITSILSIILTSDQYLSVTRAYDKVAAMRQQEAINLDQLNKNVTAALDSVSQYMAANPSSDVTRFLIGLTSGNAFTNR